MSSAAAVPSSAADAAAGDASRTGERFRGELELTVAPRNGRSVAVHQFHRGALRVLRPLYLDESGQVTYVVVNPGGAYLDRDRYRLDLTVEEGGDLQVTTQSATKVYRTPADRATQTMTVRLAAGARLVYLPDPLIAYRDARYTQQTDVSMDPGASLVLADVVTPGWSPTGDPFRYDRLRLRTCVSMGGRPVAVDHLLLDPAHTPGGMDGVGLLEGRTHVGTLLVVDPRIDDADVAAARERLAAGGDRLVGGVTRLAVPGLALRVLGCSTQDVTGAVHAVVNDLRARWSGQRAIDLRKF